MSITDPATPAPPRFGPQPKRAVLPWNQNVDPYRARYLSRKQRVTRSAGRAGWWTVKKAYRHRSRMWPMYAAICAGLVAEGLGLVQDGWRTALVLGVLAGLVVGWRQLRAHRDRQPWSLKLTLTIWLATLATAAWVAEAAAHGAFTQPIPGFWAVGALAGEVSWLWQITARGRERVELQAEDAEEAAIDERVEKWVTHVSCDGGALPGSWLVDMHDLDDTSLGWESTITMDLASVYTTESAVAATKRIAKVFRVPPTQVVVEPTLSGLVDEARLLVLNRNPLQQVQHFTGPTLDLTTGHAQICVHADGSPGHWRLWTPESGANHGIAAGTTGSGKSELVKVLCVEVRHSGCGVLCLADPEDGESVPDLPEGAHVFAGSIPKIRRMLQAVERVGDDRKRRRSRHRWIDEHGRERRGIGSFTPSREDPFYTVIIDEAPTVLADPECARIIAKIGKKFRKYGIGCVLVVQVPSLAELGGDLTIRSMMSSTNIVIFRTSDKLSAQMGAPADLPIDPVNLPVEFPDGSTTAGLGYLPVAGGRVSTMRGLLVGDPYLWATTGDPCPIPREDIAAAADEQGNYFLDWRELRDVDDDPEDEPEWTPTSPQAAAALHDRKQRADKLTDKILALLGRRGPTLLGIIANDLDQSKPTTSMALARLRARGLVVATARHGEWALVDAEVAVEGRELAGV